MTPVVPARASTPALSIAVRITLALLAVVLVQPPRPASAAPEHKADYVVVLDERSNPKALGELTRRHGSDVRQVYEAAVRGYAARLGDADVQRLKRDPRVAHVEPDLVLRPVGELPTGVDRIQGERHPVAAINGADQRMDADVAVLDSGIARHPDLNIAGSLECVNTPTGTCHWAQPIDHTGHGTFVGGVVGALDNGTGVVGVAPGARLWGVRVTDRAGNGLLSGLLAGLDWVARSGNIEVANISLAAPGDSPALARGIDRVTQAGVVVVAAAGNAAADAGSWVPANHPKVIAVSAVADYDGRPGGAARYRCANSGADDTLASFSNFGAVVDIAAPGVCIRSTSRGGGYIDWHGTSFAAPHVAGAAALSIVERRTAPTPNRWEWVRSDIYWRMSVPQSHPCGFRGGRSAERLLMLSRCP